jgi:hypothetical protein
MINSYQDIKFVIVGPGHTGSTWLASQLRKTKDIYISNEINWLNWSSLHSNNALQDYFIESGVKKIIGEHANTYFTYPNAARMLKNASPNAKIIIVYRDPLERAISHFLFDRRYGTIPRRLSVDYVLFPDFLYQRYITQGLYCNYLTEYLKFFNPEQLYLFISPSHNINASNQFNNLKLFLGSEDQDTIANTTQKINQSKTPLYPFIHWYSVFGKPGLFKSILQFFDKINCCIGGKLFIDKISDYEVRSFSEALGLNEKENLIKLCRKHEIAGYEFL